MCGIAGTISYTEADAERREMLVAEMCRRIAHRGPDHQGTVVIGRAAIGMRRLSIIDLANGQQPMFNAAGTRAIVFNGEIYNYREIRRSLESRGHRFRTSSDTETILAAYDEYGADCVHYLRGMFAFAIWDSADQALFAARDRVGKKPFFYSVTEAGDFVFGSEIKAILEHPGVKRDLDDAALDAYLTFGYVPEEFCIFRHIAKLQPGHWLRFADGEVKTQQYWDFRADEAKLTRSEDTIAAELLDRLREAVAIRLESEVPLGAFLSGGVDSSAVVALMSQISDQPVKTFSIGFNEDSYNELSFARLAAQHFGTEHHEFIVGPESVNIIDDLVWHFDEPFADSSALPTFIVSKLARDHVTVVLTGDGGDELFAGYTRYVSDVLGSAKLPKRVRERILRPVSRALPHGIRGKNYLFNLSLDEAARYIDSISHFNGPRKDRLYSKDARSGMNGSFGAGERLYGDIADRAGADDPLSRLLYLDSKTYLPGDILTKVDRMSMAASLEARSPLLDHKLIEFVSRIPSNLKLRGRDTKYIFRKAISELVPREILEREKQGFGVPIGVWINQQLRGRMIEDLSDSRTRQRGLFDASYIDVLVDEHRRERRDHSHALWALWVLELWQRRYIDK